MPPASSKVRSPTAPLSVYSASLSLSESRAGTEFISYCFTEVCFAPSEARHLISQKEDLKRAKVSPELSLSLDLIDAKNALTYLAVENGMLIFDTESSLFRKLGS